MRASEIKVPRKKKGAAKTKAAKLTYLKTFASTWSRVYIRVGWLKFQFNACPYSSSSDSSCGISSFNTSSVQSSNLPLKYILHKAQICLQLGIRPKFRNKWSRETALIRLRLCVLTSSHATWLVSRNNHLTGSVGKRNIAKGWSKAGIPEFFQGKTTLSAEDPFENIAAIII